MIFSPFLFHRTNINYHASFWKNTHVNALLPPCAMTNDLQALTYISAAPVLGNVNSSLSPDEWPWTLCQFNGQDRWLAPYEPHVCRSPSRWTAAWQFVDWDHDLIHSLETEKYLPTESVSQFLAKNDVRTAHKKAELGPDANNIRCLRAVDSSNDDDRLKSLWATTKGCWQPRKKGYDQDHKLVDQFTRSSIV